MTATLPGVATGKLYEKHPVDSGLEIIRLEPQKIRRVKGHCYSYIVPERFFTRDGEPAGSLMENELILGPEALSSRIIEEWGGGYNSLRREPSGTVSLYFSSSDNTDPVSNGRSYRLLDRTIHFANDWDLLQRRRWLNHSRGRYFLHRGGAGIEPPLFAALAVTDICNLHCGICGSQNMLETVNRRHMDYQVFEMVAGTLFPLLVAIEFNSRGEPLLHPRIADMLETVREHGIFFRLQTNGTQLRARNIDMLTRMFGEISISLDATGELFEYARCGAKWARVEEGVLRLLKTRDPLRLAVNLYPTLTEKTIRGAPELVRWAMAAGIDRIDFHRYEPICCGKEQPPADQAIDELKRFVAGVDPSHPIEIRVDYAVVKPGESRALPYLPQMKYPNMPTAASSSNGNPVYACMAPMQSVDIDLDGGVCVCCNMQLHRLGNALTVEAFADCWFGPKYRELRESLKRPHPNPQLAICRQCVHRYAG